MEANNFAKTAVEISGVNPKKCMKCGKCTGACPNYDKMEYHPHQFVAMVDKGQIEKLMASDSIYLCLSCMACVERCPRGVEPGKLVEAVRVMQIRQQGNDRRNAVDIAAFADENVPQQLFMAAMRKYRE
ncbi:MAG: 4Fe-4S dicluster domain-containing protein [Clostridiales bacterium]|mgnify:CR=1 FL=1|nr:4Fe-4S dicluster domain-containing protein [Clostridiales bacterium]MBP3940946.1 4Fe-4S dicluster domain-containing protein [Christensenellaceae bacterium]MBR2223552.1 4Fe-4S dicluster domain-containing protein [Christensenellaceae bacterium]MBR3842495.1 4Fe-4S dicluster domain-containing protein [Christensenellaceae bacterium]